MQKPILNETDKNTNQIEGFPLTYDKEQNIYWAQQNSYGNKLLDLHMGSRFMKGGEEEGWVWYLHPEEMLYLVSVSDSDVGQDEKVTEIRRRRTISQIYRRFSVKDIDTAHFYLTLRKRYKFSRRIDDFSLTQQQQIQQQKQQKPNKIPPTPTFQQQLPLYNLKDFRIFKIYQLSEDWKADKNWKVLVVAGTEERIEEVLFGGVLERVGRVWGVAMVGVCICEGNDFVVVEVGVE